MTQACCGNCRFFHPENPVQGVCRALPPTPIMIGTRRMPLATKNGMDAEPVITSFFPAMQIHGLCGLWQPAEQKEAVA